MTARSLSWSRHGEIHARKEPDVAFDAKPTALVPDTVALRRCAMYHRVFREIAIGYPAEAMRRDVIAGWIRHRGVTVDVTNVDDLDWTAIAGIRPSHIVMHGFDEVSGPIALGYGVGRVIIDSAEQIAILRASATTPRGVLVDITDACLDEATVADRRVDIDGLHYNGDGVDLAGLSEILFEMIAEMAFVRRKQDAVLTRLSVGDVDLKDWDSDPRSLRWAAQTIDEAVEEACIRHRHPRPALTVSPRPSTLLPTS